MPEIAKKLQMFEQLMTCTVVCKLVWNKIEQNFGLLWHSILFVNYSRYSPEIKWLSWSIFSFLGLANKFEEL